MLAQQTSAAVVEGEAHTKKKKKNHHTHVSLTVLVYVVSLSGGIRFELEEVESRYEEYPETLAFVRLLNEVCSLK